MSCQNSQIIDQCENQSQRNIELQLTCQQTGQDVIYCQIIDDLKGEAKMFGFKIQDFQKQDKTLQTAGVIRISQMLELINSQEKNLIRDCSIFLNDPQQNVYVFIGNEGSIFNDEYQAKQFNSLIQIRYRKVQVSKVPENRVPRSKNRLISFVKAKVEEWVRIKSAGNTESGSKRKLTYLEAANRIGLSKKTLDDYRQQIKLGVQNGFDFEIYKYERMNVLRNFNKNFMKDSLSTTRSPQSQVSTNNNSQEFEKSTDSTNNQAYFEVSPLPKSQSSSIYDESFQESLHMEISSESNQIFLEWQDEKFLY